MEIIKKKTKNLSTNIETENNLGKFKTYVKEYLIKLALYLPKDFFNNKVYRNGNRNKVRWYDENVITLLFLNIIPHIMYILC